MKFKYYMPEQFQEFVDTVRNIFKTSEPGIILFFPKTDRERRIEQLIQDYKFDYPVKLIQLTSQIVDEVEDVETYIINQYPLKDNECVNLIVMKSELAITEQSTSFIDKVIDLNRKDSRYRFLFISEIDFTHPQISALFSSQSRIYSNIYYFTLYDQKGSLKFIDHLCAEWKFSCDTKKKEEMVSLSGGHFWLLKEALRSLYISPDKTVQALFRNESMRFRLEQIYFSMLESERAVLKKVITGEAISDDADESHSWYYLQRMKLIIDNKITIPALEEFMKSYMPKSSIALSKKHVIVNNVIVDSHFSRKELKAIRALLEKPDVIISRDDMAKAIWPVDTESYYSEWAIDRIIARLRDKLELLAIDKDIIKTVRGKGYMIHL